MSLTPEQAEERECLAEDRAKGKKEDALIEAGIVQRFLRGGYQGASFPGAQLLTSDEHKVICARIQYLQGIEMRRDDLERILVKVERRTIGLAEEVDALKAPTWISVDERLPESGSIVLMAGSHYEPVTGYVVIGTISNWYTYEDDSGVVGITHWMPIPALPEGK